MRLTPLRYGAFERELFEKIMELFGELSGFLSDKPEMKHLLTIDRMHF